jgi:hypothetical protein
MNKYIKLFLIIILSLLALIFFNCEPTFEEFTFELQISVENENYGQVSISPEQEFYYGNEEVTITAIAEEGYEFIGWEGDIVSTETQLNIVMNSDKIIKANFKLIEYSAISVSGSDNPINAKSYPAYNFGDVDTQTSGDPVIFKVNSIGNIDLNIDSINLEGEDAEHFVLNDSTLNDTIPSGEYSTFDITFSPTTEGDKYANVIINNDSDTENYSFVIKGTSIGHKFIKVTQNDNYIPNNSDPGYDFGSFIAGMNSIKTNFTIKNIGTQDLAIEYVNIESDDPLSFLFYNNLSSNYLLPGEEATFTMKFRAYTLGVKVATVTIKSESENDPYTFTLIGTVTDNLEPEINVKVEDNYINDGDDPGYIFDDVYNGYDGEEIIFTIGSLGTSTLPITNIVLDNGDINDFIIDSSTIVSPISWGEETYFSIRFSPNSIGHKHAYVFVYSTDHDENPFVFGIEGEALRVPEPELVIEKDTTVIENGSENVYQYGDLEIGETSEEVVLSISNDGIDPLTIENIYISGSDAGEFKLYADELSTTIGIGESDQFSIYFKPKTTGLKTATITIETNDLEQNPFTFTVSGNAVAYPELKVEFYYNEILNNSELDFGGTGLGFTSTPAYFVIENTRTAPLDLYDITITGNDADQFILDDTLLLSTVNPGYKTSFNIVFNPTSKGDKTVTITISSNDINNETFVFTINATTELSGDNHVSFPGYNEELPNWEEYVKEFIGDDDLLWYDETGDKNYIQLKEKARVWVTFVHEEAGYKNRLGYYLYDDMPVNEDAISEEEKITIFDNITAGSDTSPLQVGDTAYLGEHDPADKSNIALWLHQNGFNYPDNPYWYPFDEGIYGQDDYQLNQDSKRHSIMFVDKDSHEAGEKGYLLFGFEDLTNLGDRDFNDVIVVVTIEPVDSNLSFEDVVDISNMITINQLKDYLQIP